MDITLEQMLENSKGLIYQIAKRYYLMTNRYGIEFDDLYQVGCLALIENYPDYDPSKGAVSTFVYFIIRGAILNYLNANCTITHIPNDLHLLSQKLAKENIQFHKKNGRYMTEEEQILLLKKIPCSSKYQDLKQLLKDLNKIILYHYRDSVYALDDLIINFDTSGNTYELMEHNPTIGDLLVADFDIEEEAIFKVDLERFLDSLYYLTDREKKTFIEILGLRDGICKTGQFLSVKENVSRQAIDQRYQKALTKIKQRVKKELI